MCFRIPRLVYIMYQTFLLYSSTVNESHLGLGSLSNDVYPDDDAKTELN